MPNANETGVPPFEAYLKRKSVEGVTFDLWIGDRTASDWYDLDCSDPVWLEMGFIRDHLIVPGDVVFECGGHQGCTAILMSEWVGPEGRVVTFEASPANADILERNVKQNGLRNVTVERMAVGSALGRVFIDGGSNASVSLSGTGREVELTCLDQYADLRPNLLKLDVEGFEVEVLRGANSILSTHPKLAIEIHAELPRYGSSVEELLSLIDVPCYNLWVQWDDARPPERYDGKTPIDRRVHLYGIPRESEAR